MVAFVPKHFETRGFSSGRHTVMMYVPVSMIDHKVRSTDAPVMLSAFGTIFFLNSRLKFHYTHMFDPCRKMSAKILWLESWML